MYKRGENEEEIGWLFLPFNAGRTPAPYVPTSNLNMIIPQMTMTNIRHQL